MFTEVLISLIVVTTVVSAHHAYSSQYVYRQDGPAEKVIIHDEHGHHHVDYHAHPKYKFEYKVDDYHTGDHKHQQEWRDGHDTDSKYSWHVKHVVPKKHHETKEHHHEDSRKHHKEWQPKKHQEWQTKHHQEWQPKHHQEWQPKHHQEWQPKHHQEWQPKHHQEWQHDHLNFFDYHAYPKYEFGYKVHDPHTGDNKQHHERRDGHDTKSHYSFHLKHIVPEKHHH